jgi:hypothetical protein
MFQGESGLRSAGLIKEMDAGAALSVKRWSVGETSAVGQ